jgi:diguanylate cyclase (GGDEF)-like protein
MELTRAKKPIAVLAIIVGCAWNSGAAAPAPLTTLQAVAALSNAQAIQHQPAVFEATVTYYRAFDGDLFVQDDTSAIYIHAATGLKFAPGDRVLVRGTMHESFRPFVVGREITVLGPGALPEPVKANYQQMIRGETDCRLVRARAIILSADMVTNSPIAGAVLRVPFTYLQMLVDGAPVDANVDSADAGALSSLLDAEVEITGVESGHFDNKMQQTGVLFHVQTLAGIKVIRRAAVDPWSLPVTPMDRLIKGYRVVNLSQRTRVHGTITYYQPQAALVLQDGAKSVWIATETHDPLRTGDVADAIGLPDVQNGFLMLNRSEIRDSSVQAPIVPPLLTWSELASGGNTTHSQAFNLVSIEGLVVTEVRQATQDEYVLETGGHLFSAIIRHPARFSLLPLAAMKQVPVGARIRVTGICMLEDANPFNGDVPFNILMRSYDDIVVVANPSLLNVHNLIILAGVLLLLVFAAVARSWALERKIRLATTAAAYLEQRRGRVLEDINNARPLNEVLAQITQLVSFKLQGAACWCHIAAGAPIGTKPVKLTHLRVAQEEIPARSGTPHGAIFAALDARTRPQAVESEALAFAAGLATLAIETSHLYSDLIHRSEFDLLTDIQNRFSLEKILDSLISKARMTSGAFALIYIDLDGFKQVNDVYGHQVGDCYLQEAAQRMKHQLRPGDMLARLGGDEFAALVPALRNRQEVEEIAIRLERCFGPPFALDGCILRGSASVGIALYPEDADTKDGLLRAADAAMYVEKNARRGAAHASDSHSEPDLALQSQINGHA